MKGGNLYTENKSKIQERQEVIIMKQLIAYFSRADENYFGGQMKYVEVGNTEIAAQKLQKLTGADLFRIEMKRPYSPEYKKCVAEAVKDKKENARPELAGFPESIGDYDEIFLGYPSYCGTMPMAVFTFLEHFDFSGKKIRPFCTNEGSGMGTSVEDIRKLCPGAEVEDGLSIHGSHVQECDELLKEWEAR